MWNVFDLTAFPKFATLQMCQTHYELDLYLNKVRKSQISECFIYRNGEIKNIKIKFFQLVNYVKNGLVEITNIHSLRQILKLASVLYRKIAERKDQILFSSSNVSKTAWQKPPTSARWDEAVKFI